MQWWKILLFEAYAWFRRREAEWKERGIPPREGFKEEFSIPEEDKQRLKEEFGRAKEEWVKAAKQVKDYVVDEFRRWWNGED